MMGEEGKFDWWGKRLILSLYIPLAAAFIWTFSANQAQHTETHYRTQEYAAQAERYQSKVCAQLPPQAMAQCLAEALRSTRENQRAELNLEAQQETAEWTRWMTIVSGIAVFISGLGLWALMRTVRHGQATLEHAQKISRLQLRPYVYVGDVTLSLPLTKKSKLTVEVKNYGLTPAINMELGHAAGMANRPVGDALRNLPIDEWHPNPPLGPQAGTNIFIGLGPITDRHIQLIKSGDAAFVARIVLKYEGRSDVADSHEEWLFIDEETLKTGIVMALTEWARNSIKKCEEEA